MTTQNSNTLLLFGQTDNPRMAGGGKGSHPECHFAASGVAAIINFPLWRAAAIGQSGFDKKAQKQRQNKNFLRRCAGVN